MPGPKHENLLHNADEQCLLVSCFSLEHDLAPGCSRGQRGSRGRVRSVLTVIVASLPRILRRAHW